MSDDSYLNGIRYQYEGGSDYSLYPVKGKHKPKDIQRAKFRIKKENKSARIQVRWTQTEEHGAFPEKVPENVVIKSLKFELGKQSAYTEELEHQLKQKKSEEEIILSKEEKTLALKDKKLTELTKKKQETRSNYYRFT